MQKYETGWVVELKGRVLRTCACKRDTQPRFISCDNVACSMVFWEGVMLRVVVGDVVRSSVVDAGADAGGGFGG
jgi:hypothetical protein